jgi:hypothetical protein
VAETLGLESWMRANGFNPDEPTDVMLVIRMLVVERSRESTYALS